MDDQVIRQIQEAFRRGSGNPEGVVAAPVGTAFLRDDGVPGATFYVKESGASTVYGWVAK